MPKASFAPSSGLLIFLSFGVLPVVLSCGGGSRSGDTDMSSIIPGLKPHKPLSEFVEDEDTVGPPRDFSGYWRLDPVAESAALFSSLADSAMDFEMQTVLKVDQEGGRVSGTVFTYFYQRYRKNNSLGMTGHMRSNGAVPYTGTVKGKAFEVDLEPVTSNSPYSTMTVSGSYDTDAVKNSEGTVRTRYLLILSSDPSEAKAVRNADTSVVIDGTRHDSKQSMEFIARRFSLNREDESTGLPDPALRGGVVVPVPGKTTSPSKAKEGGAPSLKNHFIRLQYARKSRGTGTIPQGVVVSLGSPPTLKIINVETTRFSFVTPAMLAEAREHDPSVTKSKGDLLGTACWWILSPTWDEEARSLSPTAYTAELYTADPSKGAAPDDALRIAERGPTGKWRSVSAHLRSGMYFAKVEPQIENGKVKGVLVSEVKEAPLEIFLPFEGRSEAEVKEQNVMLLKVKNQTIPKMVREGRTRDLRKSVFEIEKAILELNRAASELDSKAQEAVSSGSGNPAPLRKLSVLYKERIEVLKPMLASLKKEVANRNK